MNMRSDIFSYENIMKVYSMLADEESKAIFWDRFKYSVTKDKIYLLDAVKVGYTYNDTFANVSNKNLVEVMKKVLSEQKECQIVVWGASDKAMTIVEILYEFGILDAKYVNCFYVDNNQEKWGKKHGWHNPRMDLEVCNPDCLKNSSIPTYVFIAVNTYSNDKRITRQLIEFGIKEENIYHGLVGYEYFLGEMYLAEGVMQPKKGDVFCDVGAFDMYNSNRFIQWNPEYEHIYAFEADPVNYEGCKNINLGEKVDVVNLGVWSSESSLSFESAPNGEYGGSRINEKGSQIVKTVSLDEYLEERKVDIIKMDIEGAELEALKGAEKIIKKYKPCLTISIYHKPEDILELPLYVSSLNSDYKIYLRHHTYGIYDTVMYAIDKNR